MSVKITKKSLIQKANKLLQKSRLYRKKCLEYNKKSCYFGDLADKLYEDAEIILRDVDDFNVNSEKH